MLHLLRTLLHRLNTKFRRQTQKEERQETESRMLQLAGLNTFDKLPATPWRMEASMRPLFWTSDDHDIFAHHEGSKARCSFRLSHAPDSCHQTMLIAFDLESNQLLLDHPFPKITESEFDKHSHFKLTLDSPTGRLTLTLKFSNELSTPFGTALLMNIVDVARHSDRRLDTRIEFDKKHAPKVMLLLPLKSNLSGYLANVSETGLCMVFYGPKDVSIRRRSGECTIEFDKDFSLKCKINIKDGRFFRKPCSQTHLRATFVNLGPSDSDKLRAFIGSLNKQSWPMFAA